MDMAQMLTYSMTDHDMRNCNPDAGLIMYTALNNCRDIMEYFPAGKNKLIILYLLQSKTSGHWTTMFRNSDGTFHFFDSYGLPEDAQLDYLSDAQRRELNEKSDRLAYLVRNMVVIHNPICYQSKYTETCGMFVTHRLHNRNMSEKTYYRIMREYCNRCQCSPDEVVARYVKSLHVSSI